MEAVTIGQHSHSDLDEKQGLKLDSQHAEYERRSYPNSPFSSLIISLTIPMCLLVCAGLGVVAVFGETTADHRNNARGKDPGSEAIGVSFFRHGMREPPQLSLLPQGVLIPNGSLPIHLAHMLGIPHGGAWIQLIDSRGRILLLKRAASLRTCPNSWGLVGEHQLEGESPESMVRRALDEELGAHLQVLVASSVNLTEMPVWYHREYADGRIDRQATWLWAVVLRGTAEHVTLKPDNEVAKYWWATPDEVVLWSQKSPADFCHDSITTLLRFSLERLKVLRDQHVVP